MTVCSFVQPAEKKASGSGILIPQSFGVLAPDGLRLLHLPEQKVELPAAPGMDDEIILCER